MLNLLWGVKAQFYDKMVSTDDTVEDINKITLDKKYAEKVYWEVRKLEIMCGKIAIITNASAPYRDDLYSEIATIGLNSWAATRQ